MVTSSNPTGGAAAWKVTHVYGRAGCAPTATQAPCSLNGMSCPSTDLCVAVESDGGVVTSSNPTGGAVAWKVTHLFDASALGSNLLRAVSCPSSNLCVAIEIPGSVLTSSKPTGGGAAWTRWPT